jgi:hypothetical protein
MAVRTYRVKTDVTPRLSADTGRIADRIAWHVSTGGQPTKPHCKDENEEQSAPERRNGDSHLGEHVDETAAELLGIDCRIRAKNE